MHGVAGPAGGLSRWDAHRRARALSTGSDSQAVDKDLCATVGKQFEQGQPFYSAQCLLAPTALRFAIGGLDNIQLNNEYNRGVSA